MEEKQKTALIIGSTGLVGKNLLEELNLSKKYKKIIALIRKPIKTKNKKITYTQIDFDNLKNLKFKADDIFCSLGTTIKKAKSKENFKKVDFHYPLEIAKIAKQNNAKQFILISAVGANKNSKIFYNKIKGEIEEEIAKLNFQTFIIIRPSFILGKREEFRLKEEIGKILIFITNPFLIGKFKKYKANLAKNIAKTMIKTANQNLKGKKIFESEQINKIK